MKKSKTLLKVLFTVIVSISIGTILMIGVYSLPTDKIKKNIEASTSLFIQNENKVENWVGYLRYGVIDNSTDSTMINIALCREYNNVIKNALLNPKYLVNRELADVYGSSDLNLILDKSKVAGIDNYARYWHGYLLYLVPGLMITNYGVLRMMMLIVESLLAILLLYKLSKVNPMYMFAYAVTFLFINPITVSLNFQNADIYVLTLIFSNIILICNNWLKVNNRYCILFTIIGIFTSFFDLLTYPIVTLTISLISVLLINEDDLKNKIFNIIVLSLCWLIGYIGMWSGKWIVASILTDTNVIEEAMFSIGVRGSNIDNSGSYISFIDALSVFKESINDVAIAFLLFISVIIIISYMLINHKKLEVNNKYVLSILPYLITAIIPLAWAFVVRNHFVTHQFLEYRSMSALVLIGLILLIKAFKISD